MESKRLQRFFISRLGVMTKKTVLKLIKIYQLVHRVVWPVPQCRFVPTCSEYMYEAVEKYGVFVGSYLGLRRLFRCHPFRSGGYDPL